jgi:hypothetical protein
MAFVINLTAGVFGGGLQERSLIWPMIGKIIGFLRKWPWISGFYKGY